MTALFYPGHAETLKAAVHATAGALATVCALYNTAAWLLRGERHLALNAALYTSCAYFELHRQVPRHLAAR